MVPLQYQNGGRAEIVEWLCDPQILLGHSYNSELNKIVVVKLFLDNPEWTVYQYMVHILSQVTDN